MLLRNTRVLEMVKKNKNRRVIQLQDLVKKPCSKQANSLCKFHAVGVGGAVGGLSGPLRRLEDDSELKS